MGTAMHVGCAAIDSARGERDWLPRVRLRRMVMAMVVVCQCTMATSAMVRVLPYHGGDVLEICLALVFSLLFLGISIGFWFGVYGFWLRMTGGDRFSLHHRHPESSLAETPLSRTAIVMPIYHEPIERTFAGVRALYRSLSATGQIEHFDIFVLSDSRNPEFWLAEQEAWYRLCRELDAGDRLFYRRRSVNLKHKSGNVADFFRRWGRNYKYVMVLDADSLIAGSTVVRMVRLMEVEPRIGILQSSPTIVNALSFFARTQQFANRLYGPIFVTGLAALQLGEATYWGHNALIRSEPFMHHCGLRHLPGKGLCGGAIMSHDFVEAAYMGRAGYEVWLEPELPASYEESPPTLVEDLVRDRRWAKGNLQHLWLLFHEKGLKTAHRLAFVNGIMSYLASPLWLIFLLLTTCEMARLILLPINYFPKLHSPFPVWPQWNPELAITLVSSTCVLLFLPKFLAVIEARATGRSAGFGGLLPLFTGVIVEMVISALLAPVRMLAHSRFVFEALCNVNLQWAGQNRSSETSWRVTLLAQLPGTVLAALWATFSFLLDRNFFYWSLPVVLPLLLSTPVSMLLGRVRVGQALCRAGLLVVAEERRNDPLIADLQYRVPVAAPKSDLSLFEMVVIDPVLNRLHQALAREHSGPARQEVLARLRRLCLEKGSKALTVREQSILAQDRQSLRWIHQAVWKVTTQSCWWRLLSRL